MKYNISDNKLKTIINDLGEEYKDLLIEYNLRDTNEKDVDTIRISELIKTDIAVKTNLRNGNKIQRQNQLLSVISLLGITYAMLGLMLMTISQVKDRLQGDPMMIAAVIIVFLGLSVSILSLNAKNILNVIHSSYDSKGLVSEYEIINKWKEVESLIYELTPGLDKMPLPNMISDLKNTGILSGQDVYTIHRLLSSRNTIVHKNGKELGFSQNELKSIMKRTDRIICKLKKYL